MYGKRFLVFACVFMLMICGCASVAFAFGASASASSNAVQLKLFMGPTSVLADNQPYDAVVVQLQNSRGIPVRAATDLEVSLSSAIVGIGTVDPSVTISKGATYAIANFYSTFTPGTTTITATASGYTTVQAPIITVGPLPSVLAVYGFPATLPADGGTYNALVVQLQDSSGAPARAPLEGIEVTLSSSNAVVAAVDPSIIIEGGKTYAVASIKTSTVKGSAVITSIASGYSSKQATITTQNMTPNYPTALKITLGPPKVLADGNTYAQVSVQLQNSSAKIARAIEPMTVTLSSSAEAVGTVEQTITIPAGETFATATFTTTYRSGSTTIMAAATNCTANQATLTTVGPIPSKLAVYAAPVALPADGKAYEVIHVQLQDSRGKPAKDPLGDVIVYLFSSAPDAGNSSTTLTIPFGKTYATASFFTTLTANLTTITAQASGYDPGQVKITTYLIDQYSLETTLTADPESVNANNQTTIRAYVTFNGSNPATRINLNFTANKGGNFTGLREEGDGYYTITFNAPKVTRQTVCTITANATKTGYTSTNATIEVTVNSNSAQTKSLQLHVVEDNGDPINDAVIMSQTQPPGASTLSGITNVTGYVTFANAVEGNYTIQVTKEGYEAKTQTIQLGSSQPTQFTVNIAKTQSGDPLQLIMVVAVVIVAVLGAILFIRKRRNNAQPTENQLFKKTKRKKQEAHF